MPGAQHGLDHEVDGVDEQVVENFLEPLVVTDDDIALENRKVIGSQTTSTYMFMPTMFAKSVDSSSTVCRVELYLLQLQLSGLHLAHA
jgi:hypothetical protein